MTFAQIGERLGISQDAAKQAFYHGLFKLRKQTPHACALLLLYAEQLKRARAAQKVR